MSPQRLAEYSPGCQYVGPACLKDHRLAFNRRSVRTHSGVADIGSAPGMTVWGALYDIDESDLAAIDDKEGSTIDAYTRVPVSVLTLVDGAVEAITYKVVNEEPAEVRPSDEYMDGLIEGARACGLPEPYLAFLEAVRSDGDGSADGAFRRGMLVRATGTRAEARGTGLVKVSPVAVKQEALGRYAAVLYDGKAALAHVCVTDDCESGVCELDQSIRQALGIHGRESYGACIELAPIKGLSRRRPFPLVNPRTLVLPVWPPSWLDSEKQILVLHEKNIAMLGLTPGEGVRIWAVVPDNGAYRLKKIERRVFGGSAPKINRAGTQIDYPRIDEAYLDSDGRQKLGMPERYPALVEPDVRRLFSSRLLLYGVTLFLGVAALAEPIHKLGASDAISVIAAFVVALVATLLLVLFDIRGRVRY
jgi:gamma-glutamylcyclotransferase